MHAGAHACATQRRQGVAIAPGRRALVTGGASGFGLEISRRLIAAGAQVAVVDISTDALERAAADLGPAALAVPCDVRSPVLVQAAVDHAAERFGGLDTLVISAGVIHIKPLGDVTEADWDRTLDINLKGAFLAMQAAAPHLVDSGRGRIVAISSDAGKRGFSWIQAYTASKFGLVGLVESVAVELASAGVTVNAVCPVGAPDTGMGQAVLAWKIQATGRAAEEILASAARTNPLGRNATESDVAGAVLWLIDDDASFVTGVALDVDGGAHLGFLPGT
jgi:NAD(P)-dependent dehydrogenase (short-subunit alcohol dehydrogenase family)